MDSLDAGAARIHMHHLPAVVMFHLENMGVAADKYPRFAGIQAGDDLSRVITSR